MPKKYIRKDDGSRKILAAKMLEDRVEGLTLEEIAEKHDKCRQTVAKILSSKESEAIVKGLISRRTRLAEKALDRVEAVIDDTSDNTNALKAATSVLKSEGVFRDTVDINHHIPVPTVVRFNGEDKILLGTKAEGEEDEDEDPS